MLKNKKYSSKKLNNKDVFIIIKGDIERIYNSNNIFGVRFNQIR